MKAVLFAQHVLNTVAYAERGNSWRNLPIKVQLSKQGTWLPVAGITQKERCPQFNEKVEWCPLWSRGWNNVLKRAERWSDVLLWSGDTEQASLQKKTTKKREAGTGQPGTMTLETSPPAGQDCSPDTWRISMPACLDKGQMTQGS